MKLASIYLLLGTNLGNRIKNLKLARQKIQEIIGVISSQSSIYETSAWGKTDQAAFLNQVILLDSSLSPLELLHQTQQIEHELGRIKTELWGERIIDIDILYYSDIVFESKTLTIPHPFIQERNFTLVPLAEIAPDFLHPKLKQTNLFLFKNCLDNSTVTKY